MYYLSKMNEIQKKNLSTNLFPREKSISPRTYIEHNLIIEPYNKKKFRSYNLQLKCFNDEENTRNSTIKKYEDFNKRRNNVRKLYSEPNPNDTCVASLKELEKDYFDKRVFHFNNYFENSIPKKKKIDLFKHKKIKIANFQNLIPLEDKINNLMTFTDRAINYLNNLSSKNAYLINKIKKVYKDKS